MANQKIPSAITDEIRSHIINLVHLPVAHEIDRFPLDPDAVQALMLPPDDIATCRDLANRGVSGISRTDYTTLRFTPAMAPAGGRGLPRNILVTVWGTRLFYPRYISRSFSGTDSEKVKPDYYFEAMTQYMSVEDWNKLTEWAERMVHALRREQLVRWFLDMVTHRLHDTTRLHLTWPLLATFTTDAQWRNRIHEVNTRALERYQPSRETAELVARYRHAVEEIIADASLLSVQKAQAGRILGTVGAWQVLPNEWRPEQ